MYNNLIVNFKTKYIILCKACNWNQSKISLYIIIESTIYMNVWMRQYHGYLCIDFFYCTFLNICRFQNSISCYSNFDCRPHFFFDTNSTKHSRLVLYKHIFQFHLNTTRLNINGKTLVQNK